MSHMASAARLASLTCGTSEEQQPLESFFRAKGIKTKNEMADDVSKSAPPSHDGANDISASLERYSRQRSRMMNSRQATMEQLTAEVQTKTTRASTRTSRRILSRTSPRSMMKIITAADPIAIPRWRMRTMMHQATRRKNWWSGRRRSKRCLSEAPD